MSKLIIFLMLFFIVFLFLVLYLMKYRKEEDIDLCIPKIFQFNEHFSNFDQSEKFRFPVENIVNDFKIEKVKQFEKANLIMFSDYTLYDQNFEKIPYRERCNYKIFAINGIDLLANKKLLAERLKGHGLIPISYSLDSEESKQALLKDHFDNKLYICKSNIQRQEGLLITSNTDFILNEAWNKNYVVAQELLQDPFLVNGRKINLRIYLLIVIKGSVCDWYIYNDGFLYFAPDHFVKGSEKKEVNITSGFIDRSIYRDNPLTLKDLYKQMGEKNSTILQTNIEKALYTSMTLYRDDLIRLNKNSPGLKFSILGVDIAPDKNMNVLIMEKNKGVSIDKKDDRDGELKYNMIKDTFGVVGIIGGDKVDPNNFILLQK